MRIIRTKVYSFEELNKEAQQVTIEEVRNEYYEDNDFANWAIDDCSLLEPKHEELIELFPIEYNFPLLKNNRKVYFSTDRDRYIDISNAMEVQNDRMFLVWLGINGELLDKVHYIIGEDSIEFTPQTEEDFTEDEEAILKLAEEKFENHCEDILKRIEADIDYRFTDEAITEDILANDYEFLSNGKKY